MKGKAFTASARQIYIISQESIESFPELSQWLKPSNYPEKRNHSQYEASSETDGDTKLLEEETDKMTAIAEGIIVPLQ